MPRIHPQLQDCVFFLYRRSPKTGAIEGPFGTGFFISRSPLAFPGLNHLYAVTNWHVAIDSGASIMRVNCKNDTTRLLEYDPMDWHFDRGDDLAIVDVHDDLRKTDNISYINERQFLAGDFWTRAGITIGEDTFMIGLFANHHGGNWNTPCARFGNISMLASKFAPVAMETGTKQPCHLVDTHSRGGFSGSPVFAYRTNGTDLTKLNDLDQFGLPRPTNVLLGLLGIHCGQFWEDIQFRKSMTSTEAARAAIFEGDKLKVPSSMTIVMPAWRISTLLDTAPFDATRKQREAIWRASRDDRL